MKFLKTHVRVLVFILGMSGCGNYYEDYSATESQKFSAQETLGFSVARVIFERNRCLNCHANAHANMGRVNLETHANASAVAARIKATLAEDLMPPRGPAVSAEDKAIIFAWVDAGAPEVSELPLPGPETKPTPTPAPPSQPEPTPPQPTPVDFSVVRARIFEPHCIECHGRFSKYAKVVEKLADIQRAVESDEMPKDQPPLAPDLKQLLAAWIQAGAPETVSNEPNSRTEGL